MTAQQNQRLQEIINELSNPLITLERASELSREVDIIHVAIMGYN